MRYLENRVKVICNELRRLERVQSSDIRQWKYKKGFYLHPADVDKDEKPWEEFNSNTMHWYGPDEHYWFRTCLTVPESFDGKALWLTIKTQINDWDDGRNPQFLVFINGVAAQGLDMNHREVFLTGKAVKGTTYQIDLQAYTGTIYTEFCLVGRLEEYDADIIRLYYDIMVPLSAFGRMDKEDKTRLELTDILNETVNLLDLRTPYSEEFYRSLKNAQDYISGELYGKMAGFSDVTATCIGHTHIDVAWWWTVEQTREKVTRSFATVLKLMEEYPNYKFMSSQPQLYYFLKERYPELFNRIKERIKEGRWEPEGGMWVEADCNLTSGESLIRQFMHGKRFFREEFGVDSRILWLPDVFGYSGALPQIMKKCGIDYFMTTKLSWNQLNKIPYDTMMWKGIDGTKVLTHLISTLGVGQPSSDFFTTYNGMLHPDAIMGGWQRYQNKEINNDILVSYGYGDGGGGPTREMLEHSIRMEKGIKGIPNVRQEFAGVFFRELDKRVKDNKRLPVWEGELYFEYHRGTYTSMARNKRANRKSELMLMDLELLSVLAEKSIPYPNDKLDSMWKVVLLNQFHDILPGTAIHEVYEVTKKEYEQLAKEGYAMINDCLKSLTVKGEGITLFNTCGFIRDDIVRLGQCNARALLDMHGNICPVQQTADGAITYVEDLPSKGHKAFIPVGDSEFTKHESLEDNCFSYYEKEGISHIDTPFYSIRINDKGNFISLYDKENDRELVQPGKALNRLVVYEDKPMSYDNWDIDMYYTEKSYPVDDLVRLEWAESGCVRSTLRLAWNFNNSKIEQNVYFYKNNRRIDFDTHVDWKEHQHLLKVHFPVDVHTDEAVFEIQFGNVKRKTHTNTSWDEARFESCGQKWMDISEGHYGVSVLNDCKYGHSVRESDIGLTLVKSGIEPNPVTDQEDHYFIYSLYPHEGGWADGNTVREAYKLNQPVYAVNGMAEAYESSFVAADKRNVMIETVKRSEDGKGIIIRLYEFENARTKTTLTFGCDISEAYECNLIEDVCSSVDTEDNRISLVMKPYEIKTLKIIPR